MLSIAAAAAAQCACVFVCTNVTLDLVGSTLCSSVLFLCVRHIHSMRVHIQQTIHYSIVIQISFFMLAILAMMIPLCKFPSNLWVRYLKKLFYSKNFHEISPRNFLDYYWFWLPSIFIIEQWSRIKLVLVVFKIL